MEFESEPEEKANDITKLSQTRWTVRATCLQRVIDNYEALMKVWIHCLDNGKMESELKGRIIGVKTQMESFELYFGLHLGGLLYSHTDNLWWNSCNKIRQKQRDNIAKRSYRRTDRRTNRRTELNSQDHPTKPGVQTIRFLYYKEWLPLKGMTSTERNVFHHKESLSRKRIAFTKGNCVQYSQMNGFH